MKDPCRTELREVILVDLRKTRVSAAGVVAVVREPVSRQRLSQQVVCMYIDCGGYSRRRIIPPGQQTAEEDDDMERTPHAYESLSGFAMLASPKLPRSTPRSSCK